MPSDVLERGRAAYAERRWSAAFDSFAEADAETPLGAQDLECWSTAAVLLGRDVVGVDALTRAHEVHLAAGDTAAAARCAAWNGIELMDQGDHARSAGWFARAERLAQQLPEPAAVSGFVLIPQGLGALYAGDGGTAAETFDRIAEFATAFRDPDLMALSRLGQGQARIILGQTGEGFALLDEAMVAVTAGEVGPITSGVVYCAVIGYCHLAFDVRRAQEWTTALDHWCGAQSDMVAFSGQCQAHRAELFLLHGAWAEALAAAKAAQERYRSGDRDAVFGAWYQHAEVLRMRGRFDEAEVSYVKAGESAWDPEPGLSLLRLAEGKTKLAQTLIRRSADAADGATRRRMLPAVVEIELAAGDIPAARAAAQELAELSAATPMPMLTGSAGQADGEVLLAEGDAIEALRCLRRAWAAWRDLDAPYPAACCRVLMGRAFRALGDETAALNEFDVARAVFLDLGAEPDLATLAVLSGTTAFGPLTARETEVLRLVSAGLTNRAIAARLYLSEKTVARHLSNIFAKLGLPSRAAATAYAYENGLV
jgi:DNA-binding CsgD family transcriptional regulator